MLVPAPVFSPGSADGKKLGSINIDRGWRPLVEEACKLKEAVDHVSRWKIHGENIAWIESVLKPYGLSVEDFSNVNIGSGFPDLFAKRLLGEWFGPHNKFTNYGRGVVPEWAVMGWVRRDFYQHSPQLPLSDLSFRANAINEREILESDASISGFEGIPLYWAGEGKTGLSCFVWHKCRACAQFNCARPQI